MSESSSRREFMVAGALATTALASAVLARGPDLRSEPDGALLERMVPERIGSWTRSAADGVLIPKGEEPEDEIYDAVVTRFYTSDVAPPIMLLIAYGNAQTGNTQLHRPEVCYPGAGFRMQGWPDVAMRLPGGAVVTGRSMTATATGRIEQILYWSRVGHDFPTSSVRQRWSVFRQTLNGAVPDGALVRISTIGPDHDAALPTLRAFADKLVTGSSAAMRRLLIGAV